jgi:hypothetical protein
LNLLLFTASLIVCSCKKESGLQKIRSVENTEDDYNLLKKKVYASYNIDMFLAPLLNEREALRDSLKSHRITIAQFIIREKAFVKKLIALDPDILKLKADDITYLFNKKNSETKTRKFVGLLDDPSNADLWDQCYEACQIELDSKMDAIEIRFITAESDFEAESAFYYQQCIAQYTNPTNSDEYGCQNYAEGIASFHLLAVYQAIEDDQDQAINEWVYCENACDTEYGN